MQERTRRSPARFLAPLAFVAFVFVLFVVITGSAVDDGGGNDSGRATETQEQRSGSGSDDERAGTDTTETTPRRQGRRTYVIKTGDTLGAISEQTGVPLEQLQELNPDLDPQAMVAGQRIKLRE